MTCSDWISIICASVSLVVTIVIAGLQLWQSQRMEKFERRQDERDERRHAEGVKSQAVSFISKHYADRGLIPYVRWRQCITTCITIRVECTASFAA